MSYLGSWKIDDALTFPANTHDASDGSASDADSPPSYRVYEDETATPILTGSMALLDSGNTTGFYTEQITLSAANGFEKGKSYTIYIEATVDSITGTMAHTFQMEAEVDANTISPTVSADVVSVSGDSTAADNLEADYDGDGYNKSNSTIGTVTTNTDMRGTDSAYTGTPPTAAAITDAVWDEAKAGHVAAGSFGEEVQAHALTSEVSALNDLDAAGVRSAVGLASANLDTQLAALPTAAENRAEVDSNSTQLAAIVADTNELQADDVPGLIAALNDLSAAQVNAQVVDALSTDTQSLPGQGAPSATPTLAVAIMYLYKAFRNKIDQDATTFQLYADDASTVDQKATISDDGTTFTRGELTTGP